MSMSSFTSAATQGHNDSSYTAHSKPDVPEVTRRMILDQNGKMLYASPTLKDSVTGYDEQAFEIIKCIEPRKSTTPKKVMHADDGTYLIKMGNNNTPALFRFDWVKDQKRYKSPILIASEIRDIYRQDDDLKNAPTSFGRAPLRMEQKYNATDMRVFMNMNQDMQIILDSKLRFLSFNSATTKILGHSDVELQKISLLDIVSDQDRYFAELILSELKNAELNITKANGENAVIAWSFQRNNNKIYALGRDITNDKNQQSELSRRQSELAEAQSIAHLGHWRWVVGSNEFEWSEEIFKIFELSAKTFKPSVRNMEQLIGKNETARLMQGFQRALLDGRNYAMEFTFESSNGDTRFINCEGRCERDKHGDVIALFGILHDFTEQKCQENALREAKDIAERAYASKSRFLANMSHELRTPLNAIIGFSEMMETEVLGPIGNEKYADYAQGIRKSGQHLLDLIGDILDMSKIEAGKYELQLSDINVCEVIDLAIQMINGRAEESGINIIGPELCEKNKLMIVADRRAVLQILLNLLSNAVKFSDEKSNIFVRYTTQNTGDISLSVSDEGPGIPAHKIQKITQPFEQLDGQYTRDHQGTGLGLAITKELVEMHGGTLKIVSKVGSGTCVSFTLPENAYESGRNSAGITS